MPRVLPRLDVLCTEVTVLAAGRTALSGPPEKLAAENGELDAVLHPGDKKLCNPDAGGRAGFLTVGDISGKRGFLFDRSTAVASVIRKIRTVRSSLLSCSVKVVQDSGAVAGNGGPPDDGHRKRRPPMPFSTPHC